MFPNNYERKTVDGYTIVKVENNVWKLKQILMYEKYHDYKMKKGEVIIFLNHNKQDFSEENLYKLNRGELAVLNKIYPDKSCMTPDQLLAAILTVKIKIRRVEIAKKNGLCNKRGRIISDSKESNKEYNAKNKEKHYERTVAYRQKIYADPVKKAEYLRKAREYKRKNKEKVNQQRREYYYRQKALKQTIDNNNETD